MPTPSFSLEGRVALITGSRRGLGRTIALAFAGAGADVAVCDSMVESGDLPAVAEEIRQLGRRSLAVQLDLTRKPEVEKLVKKIEAELGPIDILVNNAGGRSSAPLLHETSEEEWQTVLDNNLKTAFICSQVVIKGMIKRKRGNIINLASAAGLKAFTRRGSYNIAKAGVIMLTRNLAWDLGKYNIRVNALAPSQAITERTLEQMSPEDRVKAETAYPLRRLATVDDIIGPALFLASDASSYVTGHTLVIDGGLLA